MNPIHGRGLWFPPFAVSQSTEVSPDSMAARPAATTEVTHAIDIRIGSAHRVRPMGPQSRLTRRR